ncbi:glycerol-3-phosphate 1-O-acyltransferase PlsY [Candidatus Riflebacteria bacterium]
MGLNNGFNMDVYRILFLLFAYFLGTIPFSLIVAKFKGIDLLKHGSGNLGATNVYRVLGLYPAIVVFLADTLKGILAVCLSYFLLDKSEATSYINIIFPLLSGFCCIFGHTFSFWVAFRGGKGIATSFGVLLFLMPQPVILSFVFFWLILLLSSYVSLSSITAAISLPFFLFIFQQSAGKAFPIYMVFVIFLAAFVIYKHKSNIKRLLQGTENRVEVFSSLKKKSEI